MALRDRLKAEEGLRLVAYHDEFGWPTQGYGHLLKGDQWCDLSQYPDITEQQAEDILSEDIATASSDLLHDRTWVTQVDPVRRDVLVEMVFEMGIFRFLKFVNTIAACQKGNYTAAAAGMRASSWYKELPKRVERLAMIMQTGQDV